MVLGSLAIFTAIRRASSFVSRSTARLYYIGQLQCHQ